VAGILQETFFFGSSLVLALVSAEKPAFVVGDLDIICVLPKEFKVQNWMKRICFFPSTATMLTTNAQSLNNVCCGRFIDRLQHVEKHKEMSGLMLMPGETCENVRLEKFQHTRRWFGPMKMVLRKMYNPTIGRFCAMSRNVTVASPKGEKKTTDIVFIHNTGKHSAGEFAWDHVKETPFFPGVNMFGADHHGQLKLTIGNFEMLQTRTCVIPHASHICHGPTGKMTREMFEYLKKYVTRNICDLVFEFFLDDLESVDNMATFMLLFKDMKTKRIPENDHGIVKFFIFRHQTVHPREELQ